jgi:hypothetical protein
MRVSRAKKGGEKTVFKQLRNQGKQTGESKIVRYRILEMLINRTIDTVLATNGGKREHQCSTEVLFPRCGARGLGMVLFVGLLYERYDTRDTMGGGTTKIAKK